jgi:dynein heavy chain
MTICRAHHKRPAPCNSRQPQAAEIKAGLDIFNLPSPPYTELDVTEAALDALGRMWGLVAEWEGAYSGWKGTAFEAIKVGLGVGVGVGGGMAQAGSERRSLAACHCDGSCKQACLRQDLKARAALPALLLALHTKQQKPTRKQVDELEDAASRTIRAAAKLSKDCGSWPVWGWLKEAAESFKRTLPLITDLRSPGMRPRHWQQLKEHIGRE